MKKMFLILALLTAGWCTALTAEDQPNRWSINTDQSIRWQTDKSSLPHYDHIEMAGRRVATVLRYGINEDGSFYLDFLEAAVSQGLDKQVETKGKTPDATVTA